MKYSIWLAVLFSFCNAQAQDRFKTAEDYKRKANRQKTVAWVLAGSGATMIAAGTILAVNTSWGELDYDDNSFGKRETFKAAGSVALIGRLQVTGAGSISLYKVKTGIYRDC
ncbi:MAG: hypothetical protein EOO04_00005 [Chitinophagaceae bacterium]|nr:MAG: hypothetical protein EOO04_00005 [Chitinophagaceae bacterium]